MKRFTPNENGVEVGEHGCVARHDSGRFCVVWWNMHHQNWVRTNRREGGAAHRNLETLVHDNLGGGPILMTLTQARDEAGIHERRNES